MASSQTLTTWYGQDGRLHKAPVASLESVSKHYGQTRALVNFNLEVSGGELVASLGPNGAGKTTAIKLLLGLARPTSGKLSVFGSDPSLTATHVRVGAMLQVGRVPETLRVREHIDLFCRITQSRCQSLRHWRLPALKIYASANSGHFPVGKSSEYSLRWPFVAIPIFSFWTNRPSGWGRRSASSALAGDFATCCSAEKLWC